MNSFVYDTCLQAMEYFCKLKILNISNFDFIYPTYFKDFESFNVVLLSLKITSP